MSKENFMKAAQRELQSLNRAIDQKIITGVSYARESRRHKFLTSQLNRVRHQSLWQRVFSFA